MSEHRPGVPHEEVRLKLLANPETLRHYLANQDETVEQLHRRVRQMEEALFTLRNLIFVLDDSATDMGAECLVDTEKYERLLDAARGDSTHPEAKLGEA